MLTFLIFLTSKLSATTLIERFLIFKFLILINDDEDTTLPFHLLGLKGLIGVIATFLEYKGKIGPLTERFGRRAVLLIACTKF